VSRVSLRHAPLVAVAAALAWLASPDAAGAEPVEQAPQEILDYWTHERMNAAVPGDRLLEQVRFAGPLDELGLGLAGGSERGKRAEKVSNPRRAPYRTHGKVFFSDALFDYVCSGTVVRSKTKSLVVSAGHCTHSGGSPVDNWMFVPAKDGSREPFGRWAATKLATTPQWQNNEDIRYDVGMATMAERNGKKIQQRVGARDIDFNRNGDQRFRAFGYPAEGRFDGRTPYSCKSRQNGSDNSQGSPPPNRISCDMTGGSSGGGWIVGKGKVNSVVSYGYECTVPLFPCENPEKGNLFGPYFGAEIKKLYRSQKR
jgi:V8-like Glu-specific endopeptidase